MPPERIVAAAAKLVAEVGPEAFSMRELAAQLNTGTATLYRQFSGKDELMVHVVDRMFESDRGRPHRDARPRTWPEAAQLAALALHRTLSENPNVVPLLVTQVPIGPNALAARERFLGALVTLGLSPRLAARAYTTIVHYVIGFAIQQHTRGAPGPDDAAEIRQYYQALDAATYPHTSAAASDLTTTTVENEFLEGLHFILAGITHTFAQ